jgi:hypothetical protein
MPGERNGLLLYTQGISPGDAIELAASLQRQFPDRQVQPTDFRWRMSRSRTWEPRSRDGHGRGAAIAPVGPSFPMDYAYLVLGWLVGTVGKSAAEEAIKAATDVVLRWMRSRRKPARFQLVELLGPDGELLKMVQVPEPDRASRRVQPPERPQDEEAGRL